MDHDEVRPDIVVLGKALSGGTMPVSQIQYNRIAFLQPLDLLRPGH